MGYYPEPDSQIRHKVKVVLALSNYATKKELDHATGLSDLAIHQIYTPDLDAKKIHCFES